MDNPYKVLLLPEDSPPSMVNYAYRLLAGRWHPDKNPDDRQEATRRMKIQDGIFWSTNFSLLEAILEEIF